MFKNQGPPSLSAAVFVKFDTYEGPTITSTEGNNVVPIVPIKRSWEGKSGTICSRQQVPLCLAWAITVHKSQGLTLSKAKINIGSKEFAAGLTFIATNYATDNYICDMGGEVYLELYNNTIISTTTANALYQPLITGEKQLKLELVKVKEHNEDKKNNIADRLAKEELNSENFFDNKASAADLLPLTIFTPDDQAYT
ncbi:ATP-dependent DNA helicase Pif1-like [Rhizophagus clarus]|uniref:ATP-dependent DNA helicase Pif1-like n=1 Tax=Rhizophagus clarus TaxID=94130 RepID=A0A8H3QUQ1_9GLOM|nr:ATP-dependent DNA helicase Pif1-like [Rhizophagus clarus]